MTIRAIPTTYAGTTFRSRAEAAWARALNEFGFRWEYEIEGLDLGGVWYLPDFYLRDSRTWFEVKGVWRALDLEKVGRLWASAIEVGQTVAVGQVVGDRPILGLARPTPADLGAGDAWPAAPFLDFTTALIMKCRTCSRPYMLDWGGSYRCLNCGAEWYEVLLWPAARLLAEADRIVRLTLPEAAYRHACEHARSPWA